MHNESLHGIGGKLSPPPREFRRWAAEATWNAECDMSGGNGVR